MFGFYLESDKMHIFKNKIQKIWKGAQLLQKPILHMKGYSSHTAPLIKFQPQMFNLLMPRRTVLIPQIVEYVIIQHDRP